VKETEKAYLAGFFDRSGFMGVVKFADLGYDKYTARIALQSPEPKTFDKIINLCGGHLLKTKRGHSYWYLQGRDRVARLLEQLLPYLSARKRAAEKIIQFAKEWEFVPRGDVESKKSIIAKREKLITESLGLKTTWKGEAPRAKKPPVYDWEN
jgi:hypothetical protein